MEFAGQSKRLTSTPGYQDLEPAIVRQISQNAGVVRIIFDDQQYSLIRLQIFTIVRDVLDQSLRNEAAGCLARRRRRQSLFLRHSHTCCRTDIGLRQIERESTPFAGQAAKLNFTAKK